MAADAPDRKAILRMTIDEMRHVGSWLDAAFIRMKTKSLTLLGGGLATLTFLYAGGDTFIPGQVYGKIFYFIGLGLLVVAIITLLTSR